jgi:uncharacterized beta-barrel protein YwiB (DUF1934 family)
MDKNCVLLLKSIVDGSENVFSLEGRIEKSEDAIKLFYREEGANTQVIFQTGKVCVNREGDYSLRIPLVEGLITKGELELNGNTGELDIFTHGLSYSLSNGQLTARLRYDILLGDNAQEMELLMQADIRE